jgi:hypothetical protein
MNWKKMTVVVAVAFLLMGSIISFNDAEASTCYRLYYNWDCLYDGNFRYSTWDYALLAVHGDGTFDSLTGGGYGYWGGWGSSYFIQFENETGCEPMYSGTKKQGFMQCSDGSFPGDTPGCWYLKKTKWRECDEYYILKQSEKKSGASEDSPQ